MITSLRLAHQYPKDVKALILHAVPTDDPTVLSFVADYTSLHSADVAEKGGMEDLIADSYGWRNWPEIVEQRPGYRQTLLVLDANEFAACQRRWGNWHLSGRAHLGGLSDEELSKIEMPVLIIPGLERQLRPVYTRRTRPKIFMLACQTPI